MAVTIIDTPGSTANSFASLSYAMNYHKARLQNDKWINATSDKQASALIWATNVLNAREYKGVRSLEANSLEWPRKGVQDRSGYTLDDSAVPKFMADACCELAYHFVDSDLTDDESNEIKKLTVGSIEIEYKGSTDATPSSEFLPDSVLLLVKFYFVNSNNTTSFLLRA